MICYNKLYFIKWGIKNGIYWPNNSQNSNEGISFLELFSLVKKNLVLILVVTVLFTACGAIYGNFVKKPVYSTTATAVIQVDNSSLSEYNAFVYAQYLVNSMAEFIVSDNVTKEVAKTYKNQTPTRKLPVVESENAVMYGYENKYNLAPVKDVDGNIISYVGDKSFTPLELNDFKRLKDYNIFFQINASTIVGKSGFKNKRLALKLIKEGLVDFISSDIHYNRNNFMKQSYDVINKKFGKDTACKLFKTNALFLIK